MQILYGILLNKATLSIVTQPKTPNITSATIISRLVQTSSLVLVAMMIKLTGLTCSPNRPVKMSAAGVYNQPFPQLVLPVLLQHACNATVIAKASASLDCFEMSIRVDLIVGQRGENKKEEGECIKEEIVDEEEIEVIDDASEADSGVDPGQEDQVNFESWRRRLAAAGGRVGVLPVSPVL